VFDNNYNKLNDVTAFMNNITNILIYKSGCAQLADNLRVNDKKIVQYTVVCQNPSSVSKLGSSSTYFQITMKFFDKLKAMGYKYVILEAATAGLYYYDDNINEVLKEIEELNRIIMPSPAERNQIKKLTERDDVRNAIISNYGHGSSMHLLLLYSKWGFIENPDIALKFGCFDINEPNNSMILDLDTFDSGKVKSGMAAKDTRLIALNNIINNMNNDRIKQQIHNYPTSVDETGYNNYDYYTYEKKHIALGQKDAWDKFVKQYPSLCQDCGKIRKRQKR